MRVRKGNAFNRQWRCTVILMTAAIHLICLLLSGSNLLSTSVIVIPPLGSSWKASNILSQTEHENSHSGSNQSEKQITSLRFPVKQWRSRSSFLYPAAFFSLITSQGIKNKATPPKIINAHIFSRGEILITVNHLSLGHEAKNRTRLSVFYFHTNSHGWECFYIMRLD